LDEDFGILNRISGLRKLGLSFVLFALHGATSSTDVSEKTTELHDYQQISKNENYKNSKVKHFIQEHFLLFMD